MAFPARVSRLVAERLRGQPGKRYFYAGIHGYPGRRKKYKHEGFRITGRRGEVSGCTWDVRRLSRKTGEVRIPKVGRVRFRWSRAVPECKSFRVTRDRSGRWHVGFTAIPEPIPAPGTGEVVGIDRGVVITAALSTGETLHCPGLTVQERAQMREYGNVFWPHGDNFIWLHSSPRCCRSS